MPGLPSACVVSPSSRVCLHVDRAEHEFLGREQQFLTTIERAWVPLSLPSQGQGVGMQVPVWNWIATLWMVSFAMQKALGTL